jgi:hypothetical protein
MADRADYRNHPMRYGCATPLIAMIFTPALGVLVL